DPDAGVVDQHVEAPEAVAVGGDQCGDVLLIGHLRGNGVDVEPVGLQPLGRGLKLVRPPRGHGDAVAVLGEGACDREPDPARTSGNQRSPIRHSLLLRPSIDWRATLSGYRPRPLRPRLAGLSTIPAMR